MADAATTEVPEMVERARTVYTSVVIFTGGRGTAAHCNRRIRATIIHEVGVQPDIDAHIAAWPQWKRDLHLDENDPRRRKAALGKP